MKQNPLLKTRSWIAAVLVTFAVSEQLACSQHAKTDRQDKSGPTTQALATTQPTSRPIDPITARIRDEGLNHSHVMDTLDYLCNVIGQRLTGSPSCKRANDWTRQTLESWGLQNAHLESWGPFGRGWEVKRFSLQVIEPYAIVLNAYPKAWSPGFEQPFEAPVIVVDATKESELEPFKGKLKGAVVLLGKPRDLQPRFEPLASRMQDSELARLAETRPGTSVLMGQARAGTASERRAQFAASGALGERLLNRPAGSTQASTTGPATGPSSRPGRLGGGNRRGFDPFASRALKFVADEGASLVITASTQGDGGTIFVASASVPGDPGTGGAGGPTTSTTTPTPLAASTTSPSTGPTTLAAATTSPTTGPTTRPRVWATDAPPIPAQVTLAVEDYNRLARMSKQGQTLKMAVDFQARFYDTDPMCYNTIAE